MSVKLLFEHNYIFRESESRVHNYLEAAPTWLRNMIQEEYSPFRAVMDATRPPKNVKVKVEIEIDDPPG